MKVLKKSKWMLIGLLAVGAVGCSDLEVANLNQPDTDKVLASDNDVKTLASGMYNQFHRGIHWYDGIGLALATSSDNMSCSWGNQAMRDMSWEPRRAWDNEPSYSYRGTANYTFNQMYSAISTANTVLKTMDGGLDIGPNGEDNALVRAFSKFNQGIGLGYVALIFDQGYIVDENTTDEEISAPEFKPWDEVRAAALTKLDEAIALANGNTFTIPTSWMGTPEDLSSADFAEIANSYAAMIAAYSPRNASGASSVDWAQVQAYADAGITSDFSMQGDGWVQWENEVYIYGVYPGWGRTDNRVIHMMADAYPEHWTDDPSFPQPAEVTNPEDQRLLTDFEYLSSQAFRPERGYYHYSAYRHSRYDSHIGTYTTVYPNIAAAEIDMIRAEARARRGDLAGAAAIINAGTRVTRGQLAPVAPTQSEVMDAIHHERNVELWNISPGQTFFEMRKNDLLQAGTPLHWPVPYSILETIGTERPFYTFGGPDGQDGINGSNGGWR